jgi:hypothetical protein
MNSKISRKIVVVIALFAMVLSFSSCNRGYGCPYELKSTVKVITTLVIK